MTTAATKPCAQTGRHTHSLKCTPLVTTFRRGLTKGERRRICGYYSLNAVSFQRDNLPDDQAKHLPRYPVPAALLGRLAVDNSTKGKGLGAFLLMDAMNRILLASQTLAVHAVVVDAKDGAAAAFYRRYGFIPFTGEGRRLFLPMVTIL